MGWIAAFRLSTGILCGLETGYREITSMPTGSAPPGSLSATIGGASNYHDSTREHSSSVREVADQPLIAVINNDAAFAHLLDATLRDEGYDTLLLEGGDITCDSIKHRRPTLIILDIDLDAPTDSWRLVDLLALVAYSNTSDSKPRMIALCCSRGAACNAAIRSRSLGVIMMR
jgi:hypothetical protein